MKFKPFVIQSLIPILTIISASQAAFAVDDFKGKSPTHQWDFGAMGGLGIVDTSPAFGLIFSAAKLVISRGFVDDINDQVFAEVQAGPLFLKSTTAFAYSTHLRWDFIRDEAWTYYAIGGLGGNITGDTLGSRFSIAPRFGLGAFVNLAKPEITLRMEVSHEWIVAGISFSI